MNFDLNVIKRVNYSILDILADLGGLSRACTALVKLLMVMLSFCGLPKIDTFLIGKLFSFDKDDSDQDG